jgi:hypothetical protein
MTALVAAFALTPLLLAADAPGKEILHPVAVVIFGGLVSSTLLDTLLTVDSVFKRPFSFPVAPRTRRPTRLSRCLKVADIRWALTAQPKPVSLGRRLRVIPCRQADFIGPANPRRSPSPRPVAPGRSIDGG